MQRYSRHRSIPVTDAYTRYVLRIKRRYKKKDTARHAEKANGANGLSAKIGDETEPEGRFRRNQRAAPSGTRGPQAGDTRWFAQGPVHLDEAVRAASCGGCAVVVWLAVRARRDGANGGFADTTWIAKATGLNKRTIRKAVAALVDIGMLERAGCKILPSGEP